MIIGIGSDLCNIERIDKALNRWGDRFKTRVYTDVEINKGVHWTHMGVVNLPSGAPTMALTGGAATRLEEMTPEGMQAHIHLTITDDYPWAQAFVIIEALPMASS